MSSMKWGLIPHFSKFEDKSLNTTNARSEVLIEGGGLWGSIKGSKRCAVVCQGYYEWLTKGKEKLPHFVKPKDGRVMLMAGLWDTVALQGETEAMWTFTIVTTSANSAFAWLHERQPVILHTTEALNAWLDTSSHKWSAELGKLLAPTTCPLTCYPVPKEVGKVGTESPTYIQPVAERKDGIQAMFARQKQAQQGKSPLKTASKRSAPEAQDSDDSIEILEGPPAAKKAKSTHTTTKPSTAVKSRRN